MPCKGKKIIVVEDEKDLRTAIQDILQTVSFEVMEATDGRHAQSLITLNDFDVILSDIRMPHLHGIELLHFVKRTKPIPVVLMTGFSDILESAEAFEIGARDFIAKPFAATDLIQTLKNVVLKPDANFQTDGDSITDFEPWDPAETEVPRQARDQDFCFVPIEDFLSGSELKTDLYVRLSEAKYLRIAKKGSILGNERVRSYKSRGLRSLYIQKGEFHHYVGMNLQITRLATGKGSVTREQKLRLLKHSMEVLLQDAFVNGLDKNKFKNAASLVGSTIEIVQQDNQIFGLLDLLSQHSDSTYAHSLGVAVYSSLIAKEVGWTSAITQFRASLSGLLHDIGKKELDPRLLTKPRGDWNAHELKLYESHPVRGKEILSQVPSIPADIALVALHHHENRMGRGFPCHIKREEIHPLAHLIAVANRFCNFALKNPLGAAVPAKEAIEKLFTFHYYDLEPLFIAGLMNLFGVKIPEKLEIELASKKKTG